MGCFPDSLQAGKTGLTPFDYCVNFTAFYLFVHNSSNKSDIFDLRFQLFNQSFLYQFDFFLSPSKILNDVFWV